MKKIFHILNGDALKMQFPKSIQGEIIVVRECLVDGNVEGENLDIFFETRLQFLSSAYDLSPPKNYYQEVVSEFEKILTIPNDSEIHFWFEDDLFCQVNFWFASSLLQKLESSFYLVRPTAKLEFGFGGMSKQDLVLAFENKNKLDNLDVKNFARLWNFYQKNKHQELLSLANDQTIKFPFLKPAVQAHLDRFPKNKLHGRPTQTILEIIAELKTNNFGEIFRAFSKREPIYGFGDLQVKRIWERVKEF